jgi:hypothetical protein
VTVKLECPCGATIEIEDVSEISAAPLIASWQVDHKDHRRTAAEYQMWMDAIHGRTFQ